MDVDLPPVIVVRQMLRRQQQRKDNLHAWIQQAYNDGWVEGRAHSRSRSQRIRLLADGFDREMKAAGAFNILSSGSHDRLRLNSPKGLSIRGHFLWPVKFGRNITVEDPVYTEQHLMLVQMAGSFTPTKASIYEVPLLFSWSRHALERLSERSNVGNNLQDKLFSTSIELARTFAIMKAFDLTKGDPDLDASSLTMWLPYCDGLVIVTRQAAASHRDSRELGWKINFSKRRVVRNILRESRLLPVRTGAPGTVDANGNITHEHWDLTGLDSWPVTTYLGPNQLSNDQERLRHLAMNLVTMIPTVVADLIYKLFYDQSFTGNGIDIPDDQMGSTMAVIEDLRGILQSPAFKAEIRRPISQLMDAKVDTESWRKGFDDQRG